jgi:hypothetical protein
MPKVEVGRVELGQIEGALRTSGEGRLLVAKIVDRIDFQARPT